MHGVILTAWFVCFASFGWAAKQHFRNDGRFTTGMRWTIGLGSIFSLLQAAAIPTQPQSFGAAICYALALVLFWWTVLTTKGKGFGACHASLDSKELVMYGPYRWIRHPFYTSYLLAWLAGVFLHPALIVAVAAMGYIYWLAAQEEEARFLQGPWSAAYAAYRGRTGRFFISLAPGGGTRKAGASAIR